MACVGALGRFRERPDYVSMESNNLAFAGVRREIEALARLGYDRFQAIEQSEIPLTQTPPCPPREGEYAAWRFEQGSSGLFGAELDARWKSQRAGLRQYRAIMLGYDLLSYRGIMTRWQFGGAGLLRSLARRLLRLLTGAAAPGWYDTHVRHSGASAGAPPA